jgi:hypothetical protein
MRWQLGNPVGGTTGSSNHETNQSRSPNLARSGTRNMKPSAKRVEYFG